MLLTLIWLAIFFKGIEYPEFATSYTTYKVKKKENISRKQAKTIYCLKEILTNQTGLVTKQRTALIFVLEHIF